MAQLRDLSGTQPRHRAVYGYNPPATAAADCLPRRVLPEESGACLSPRPWWAGSRSPPCGRSEPEQQRARPAEVTFPVQSGSSVIILEYTF
jgi:hypothetical protein